VVSGRVDVRKQPAVTLIRWRRWRVNESYFESGMRLQVCQQPCHSDYRFESVGQWFSAEGANALGLDNTFNLYGDALI